MLDVFDEWLVSWMLFTTVQYPPTCWAENIGISFPQTSALTGRTWDGFNLDGARGRKWAFRGDPDHISTLCVSPSCLSYGLNRRFFGEVG